MNGHNYGKKEIAVKHENRTYGQMETRAANFDLKRQILVNLEEIKLFCIEHKNF